MVTKTLHLSIPNTPPYDKPESWFESFIGARIRPIVESCKLNRFWFSRYVDHNSNRSIRFRFETDNFATVETHINKLRKDFSLAEEGYADYNPAEDIGCGEKSRFLGTNSIHQDKHRRGEIAFTYLHAVAQLFLDCLVGPDLGGYYSLEEEKQSGFNVETPLEQYHHLFCNMTGVPTFVVTATRRNVPNGEIMSLLDFCNRKQHDSQWQRSQLVRVRF